MDTEKKTAGKVASKKTAVTAAPGKKTAEEEERRKKLAARKTKLKTVVATWAPNTRSIDNPYGKGS